MKNFSLRILVVDDERLARDRLCQQIELCNEWSVESINAVSDASAALCYLETNLVDVIFLDINMPGVSGLALAKTLRTLSNQIAIVFVTAYADFAV